MKHIHGTIASACALGCLGVLSLTGAGCTESRDTALKSLRAEADAISLQLDESRRALDISETLRTQMESDNRDLHERIAQHERDQRAESEQLRKQRDQEAAVAAGRIRELNAQIGVMRDEIGAKDALNAKKDVDINELLATTNQLNSSLDAHRQQVAGLELERTALAEQLRDVRKSRARALVISIVVAIGVIAAGVMTRGGRARRTPGADALLRMDTAQGHRKIS